MHTGKLLQGVVKSVDRSRKVVYLCSDSDLTSKCLVCHFWKRSNCFALPVAVFNF